MVDEAVRAAKIAAISDAVYRIRQVLPASAAEFASDRTRREVVLLNLFVAIQECLSLASHYLADTGRNVPATYGEVFQALANEGLITRELSQKLAGAAAFRNLVAHQYGAIDTARVYAIASGDLDDLLEFCRALSK